MVGRIQKALDILHREVCFFCLFVCLFIFKSMYFAPFTVVSECVFQSFCFVPIQVPRAIINLVELLNIVPLRQLHQDKTLGCPTWFVRLVIFGFVKQRIDQTTDRVTI